MLTVTVIDASHSHSNNTVQHRGWVWYRVWCRNAERALIIASGSEFRKFSFEVVESRWFSVGILLVIMVNTVFIGLQTSQYIVAKSGEHELQVTVVCVRGFSTEWYLTLVEQLFLAIYIMEVSLKIYVWRLKFFKSSWNLFGETPLHTV